MKSILEEASTIMKAIEKSWVQAGKPREFSIKILEEPVKNFIGMTTKSAKIGLFFDERAIARKPDQRDTRHPRKEREREPIKQPAKLHAQPRQQAPAPTQRASQPTRKPEASVAPRRMAEPQEQQPRSQEQRPRNIWTDDLVENAQQWVTDCLRAMDKSDVRFTVTPKQSQLVITFQDPVVEDISKQRTFFRSSSYLLMQSLRSQSKKSLRGLALLITNA